MESLWSPNGVPMESERQRRYAAKIARIRGKLDLCNAVDAGNPSPRANTDIEP